MPRLALFSRIRSRAVAAALDGQLKRLTTAMGRCGSKRPARALTGQAGVTRLKALFVCGYHTGARKNELRRLRWDQVDLENGLLHLSAAQTKGKKARVLPIYGDMRRWLEHQRETCPPGSPWVFHGAQNCPVRFSGRGLQRAHIRCLMEHLAIAESKLSGLE